MTHICEPSLDSDKEIKSYTVFSNGFKSGYHSLLSLTCIYQLQVNIQLIMCTIS